jgi:hypothetical protein
MNKANSDFINGTITISVLPQENGQYICQMSPSLSDSAREDRQYYGQNKEHAIANALERLADEYRQIADDLDDESDEI